MTQISDLELEHHGVKGMKWGKRKAKITTRQIKNARGRVKSGSVKPRDKKLAKKRTRGEKALIVLGSAWAAKFAFNLAREFIPTAAANHQNAKNVAAGAKFAAEKMAEMGLTNYKTLVL